MTTSAETQGEPVREFDAQGREWQQVRGVRCVECPDCGFTYDATHTLANGLHSCPVCEVPA